MSCLQVTHLTTANVRSTPGYLDPLLTNGMQHSELTDGYAAAVMSLVALVGQPAVGLTALCHGLLRYPTQPERWVSPGLSDTTAGAWPAEAVVEIVEIVMLLIEEFKEERIPLCEALARLRPGSKRSQQRRPSLLRRRRWTRASRAQVVHRRLRR